MKKIKFEDLKNYFQIGKVTYLDAAKRFGRLNKINPFTGEMEDVKQNPENSPTFRFDGLKTEKDYEIGSVFVYTAATKEVFGIKSGKPETKQIATFLKSFQEPCKQEIIFLVDSTEKLKSVLKLSYGNDNLNLFFDMQHVLSLPHSQINDLLYVTENGYLAAHLCVEITGNNFYFDPVITTSAAVENCLDSLTLWNKQNSNFLKLNAKKESEFKRFSLLWSTTFSKYSNSSKYTPEVITDFFATFLKFISNTEVPKRSAFWSTGERLNSTTLRKVAAWSEGKEFI